MKESIMIGKVQYVDTGNVTINIERDEFVNSVQVNQIVQINSSKTKEKTYVIILGQINCTHAYIQITDKFLFFYCLTCRKILC